MSLLIGSQGAREPFLTQANNFMVQAIRKRPKAKETSIRKSHKGFCQERVLNPQKYKMIKGIVINTLNGKIKIALHITTPEIDYKLI